jgi:hypothetical protein
MTEEPKEYKKFSDFALSDRTLTGLTKHEFIKPTEVQRQTLPWSLEGRDVVAGAKTGSGKTLALIIPVSFFIYLTLFLLFSFWRLCLRRNGLRQMDWEHWLLFQQGNS